MSDFEQLVRASRLYYELGETQNAIAEQLGVTRPQVSRLLKRARAEGIVEIRIVDRTSADSPAADALRRSYGLDAVHLAPTIAGPEDLTRRMVGRLRGRGPARRAARRARSSGSATGRRWRRPRRPSRRRATPVARDGRPAVRRLLDDRPGARTVPPRRRRARRPGARADGARSRRRRGHATGARRARGRPRDRRPLGSARRRAVRDRRAGLERGGSSATASSTSSSRPMRSARSSSRPFDLDGRFVCPALRERVIAFDARRLGRRPGRASASPRARARSGRSSARSAPASSGRWSPTSPTAEAVVALDAATLATGRSTR